MTDPPTEVGVHALPDEVWFCSRNLHGVGRGRDNQGQWRLGRTGKAGGEQGEPRVAGMRSLSSNTFHFSSIEARGTFLYANPQENGDDAIVGNCLAMLLGTYA